MQVFLRPQEVASELSISVSKAYALKHEIGFYAFGKNIRFEQSDVAAYKQRCKRDPQSKEANEWASQSDTGRHATDGWLQKRTTVSDISTRLQGRGKANGRRENSRQSERLN